MLITFPKVLHYTYQVELYSQISIGPLVTLISVFWLVYFIKQARNSFKQWRVNRFEEEGLKRKIFFHKSALIVTLLISDIIICCGSFSESISYFFKPGNLTLQLETDNCVVSTSTWLASIVYERYHTSALFEGIWQSGVLAQFCIFIALLKYFNCIYTQSNTSYRKKRNFSLEKETLVFLVTIAPQTIMLMCFDISPDMIMIGQSIFGLLALMYWLITTISANELLKTLKWYGIDMKHDFTAIQSENHSYNLKLYKVTIRCLLGVTFLFIIVELSYIICNIWIGTYITNNCWFIAHFPFFTQKTFGDDTVHKFKVFTYALIILRNITTLIFMLFVVLLNASFLIFEEIRRRKLAKLLRSKRCTESLNKPLLN